MAGRVWSGSLSYESIRESGSAMVLRIEREDVTMVRQEALDIVEAG
jgi:hypothetical protein